MVSVSTAKNNGIDGAQMPLSPTGASTGTPPLFLNNNTLAEDLQRTARTVNAACQRMEVQDLSKNRGGHVQSAPWKQIITLLFDFYPVLVLQGNRASVACEPRPTIMILP